MKGSNQIGAFANNICRLISANEWTTNSGPCPWGGRNTCHLSGSSHEDFHQRQFDYIFKFNLKKEYSTEYSTLKHKYFRSTYWGKSMWHANLPGCSHTMVPHHLPKMLPAPARTKDHCGKERAWLKIQGMSLYCHSPTQPQHELVHNFIMVYPTRKF